MRWNACRLSYLIGDPLSIIQQADPTLIFKDQLRHRNGTNEAGLLRLLAEYLIPQPGAWVAWLGFTARMPVGGHE